MVTLTLPFEIPVFDVKSNSYGVSWIALRHAKSVDAATLDTRKGLYPALAAR